MLVIGYGSVGQGIANAARAYGGIVTIVEKDPVRKILLEMIQRAGFPTPTAQHRINLERPLGSIVPDFFYGVEHQDLYSGVCVYLDGMSRHIHGNSETQQRDQRIREALRNQEFAVFSIPYGDQHNRQAMAGYFYRLGRVLIGRRRAQDIRDDPSWYGGSS